MTTLLSGQAAPIAALETELVLAVYGGPRAGQEVRLRSARCSIGSGAGCTLRLKARDVAPLHCWIIRGRDRTVVRCSSPDTRLNGRSFTEAELANGDRLSCGPIELLVVELAAGSTESPGSSREERDLSDQVAELVREREQFEAMRREADDELQARAEEARRQLREAQEIESRCREWQDAISARERELADRAAEIASQFAAFEAECAARAETETGQRQVQSQLDADRQELAQRRLELEDAERQWSEQIQNWERKNLDEQQRLAAWETSLTQREAACAEAEQAHGEAIARLAKERAAWEADREARAAETHPSGDSAEQAELEAQRRDLQTAVEALEAAQLDLREREERLALREARLDQKITEFQAEREAFYAEGANSSSEIGGAASVGPPRTPGHPVPLHAGEQEDEAAMISDYMTRLLGKSAAFTLPLPLPTIAETSQSEKTDAPPPVDPAPAVAENRRRADRPIAPERLADLNSMRELANANAREAIDRSREKQQFRTGVQRLCAAIGFAVLGVWLGYMSTVAGNWMYTLGCLSGGFGLVAAFAQGVWLARRPLQRAWEEFKVGVQTHQLKKTGASPPATPLSEIDGQSVGDAQAAESAEEIEVVVAESPEATDCEEVLVVETNEAVEFDGGECADFETETAFDESFGDDAGAIAGDGQQAAAESTFVPDESRDD